MSETKISLAPFQGITTFPYRNVYTKYIRGVNKLYTPFFSGIQKTKTLEKRASELNITHHDNVQLIPQILSKDSEEIIRFVNYCDTKGFKEVNWNLGCPYPRVANKKRGSGILPYPELIREILTTVKQEINIDLSIKCRLGYHSEKEILTLMNVFNEFQVPELTIHARIGVQLYKGGIWFNAFANALKTAKIPVVYNGDVFSVKEFETMSQKLNSIDRWMIGRGLLVDPFLPIKISKENIPDLDEQKHIVSKFVTDLYLAYRKKTNDRLQSISVMKELWSFMCYSFSNPHKVFSRIKKTKTFDEYETAVSEVLSEYLWLGSDEELFPKHIYASMDENQLKLV